MKNCNLAIILSLYAINYSFCQLNETTEPRRNAVVVYPFSFFQNKFELGYERIFNSKNQSIFLVPSIILSKTRRELKQGVGLKAYYRFYLHDLTSAANGQHSNNIFFSPYAEVTYLQNSYEEIDYPGNAVITITWQDYIKSYGAGVVIGMRWNLGEAMVLDAYFGGGIRLSSIDGNFENYGYRVGEPGYTGVLPKLGITIGPAF